MAKQIEQRLLRGSEATESDVFTEMFRKGAAELNRRYVDGTSEHIRELWPELGE